jgi:hypothetical protein
MMDMFALPYTTGAKQTTAGWRWNLEEEMDGRTRDKGVNVMTSDETIRVCEFVNA